MLPVIVGVSHDDLFLHTETESMRRVELAFSRTKLPKLASGKNKDEPAVENMNSMYVLPT